VRPGHPFLFDVQAAGKRPMTYTARGLPNGLRLRAHSGIISGVLSAAATFHITLAAKNSAGTALQNFTIIVGSNIALTPPMGWNCYNAFGNHFDQRLILQQTHDLLRQGLNRYGWTYVCIDDGWQGNRTGPDHALEPNARFSNMPGLIRRVHALGLKFGLYSTPWVTSYAQYPGGSAMNPAGLWHKPTIPKRGHVNKNILPWAVGKYSFAHADARQWARWGVDYMKYDWHPIRYAQVYPMSMALQHSGRDIVFSLSNDAPYAGAGKWIPYANLWRTTGDSRDNWKNLLGHWQTQPKWAHFARPGHWNDPDMMTVGTVGWGHLRPSRLTPNEQYTEVSAFCLMAAPLMLGCDLNHMNAFTRNLVTNEEVLAVDQDPLGVEGVPVNPRGTHARRQVWAKPLSDGSVAAGLFNLHRRPEIVTARWSDLRLQGSRMVRDLWRQRNVGVFNGRFSALVPAHGVVLVSFRQVAKR